MIRKWICVLLACSLALSLVACGGNASAEATEKTTEETLTAAALETDQGTTSAAQEAETQPLPTFTPVTAEMIQSRELTWAAELGFDTEPLENGSVTGVQMIRLADKMVELAAPGALDDWKQRYPLLRSYEKDLTRFDAMAYLFLAAQHIGGEYTYTVNDPWAVGGSFYISWDVPYLSWDLYGETLAEQFDVVGDGRMDSLEAASYNYMLGHVSAFNGEMPFAYDAATNSLRVTDTCTYEEAVRAVIRLIASVRPEILSSGNLEQLDSLYLSEELVAYAQTNPEVTAEDHPRWTGFVLGWDENLADTASRENICHIADWGFNSVRIQMDYKHLFDKDNGLAWKPEGFSKLDGLIGAALERGIHLDLCLCDLPGRDDIYDDATGTSWGEFDLYVNPAQQEKAYKIWADLARRYRDIPSYNLTFTVMWESTNPNKSTGLPAPEYTDQDVADYLAEVVDVIRAEDPDRMIIYEHAVVNSYENIYDRAVPPHDVAMEKGNVLTSYNYGEDAFIYNHMTGEAGQHIDNNNHSLMTPQYPTYYYCLDEWIYMGDPLTIDGLLPAGTVINLYLKQSDGNTVEISADGTVLASKRFSAGTFPVSNSLSGFVRFRTSDKVVSATLTKDTDLVTINTLEGNCVWCGMEVILPETYARDQWYYVSNYDVLLGQAEEPGLVKIPNRTVLIWPIGGGNSITIHEDITYSTPDLLDKADKDSLEAMVDSMVEFDGNCIVRFECGAFSGVEWQELKEYYTDLLDLFQEKNFSWWSNDFFIMTFEYPQTKIVADSPSVSYDNFEHFNLELLELLQKYQ